MFCNKTEPPSYNLRGDAVTLHLMCSAYRLSTTPCDISVEPELRQPNTLAYIITRCTVTETTWSASRALAAAKDNFSDRNTRP